MVDLDGSFAGESRNRAAVEAIVEAFPGYVQLGGGIRDAQAVEGWFNLGVARVVMGSAALKNPDFVKEMAREMGKRHRSSRWTRRTGWSRPRAGPKFPMSPVTDLARRFEDAGVASLLFTDIGRDGLLKGVNIDATVDLARRVDIPVIASGGVKGLDDIHMLALHAHEGIEGVITGRALYEGRLELAAAICDGASEPRRGPEPCALMGFLFLVLTFLAGVTVGTVEIALINIVVFLGFALLAARYLEPRFGANGLVFGMAGAFFLPASCGRWGGLCVPRWRGMRWR